MKQVKGMILKTFNWPSQNGKSKNSTVYNIILA